VGLGKGAAPTLIDLPQGYHMTGRRHSFARSAESVVEGLAPGLAMRSGVARSTGCRTSPDVQDQR